MVMNLQKKSWNILTKIDKKIRPNKYRCDIIMDMIDICMEQQKNLLKRMEQHAKDVASVIEAHNQLHIAHRQNIQSLANDVYGIGDNEIYTAEDDVNVQ